MAKVTTRGVSIESTPGGAKEIAVQLARLPRPPAFPALHAELENGPEDTFVFRFGQALGENQAFRALLVWVPKDRLAESLIQAPQFLVQARKLADHRGIKLETPRRVTFVPDRAEVVASNLIALSFSEQMASGEISFYWVSPMEHAYVQGDKLLEEDEVAIVQPVALVVLPLGAFVRVVLRMAEAARIPQSEATNAEL